MPPASLPVVITEPGAQQNGESALSMSKNFWMHMPWETAEWAHKRSAHVSDTSANKFIEYEPHIEIRKFIKVA